MHTPSFKGLPRNQTIDFGQNERTSHIKDRVTKGGGSVVADEWKGQQIIGQHFFHYLPQ